MKTGIVYYPSKQVDEYIVVVNDTDYTEWLGSTRFGAPNCTAVAATIINCDASSFTLYRRSYMGQTVDKMHAFNISKVHEVSTLDKVIDEIDRLKGIRSATA